MRFKYHILSILLLDVMDLFAQNVSVYPIYDFAIRNTAMECFQALWAGDNGVYALFLSEPAAEAGSDFPTVVRSMSKLARAEVSSTVSPFSPLKPYIAYEYRYITLDNISYVIGLAYAEYQNPDSGVTYNMTARPLYFVFTDKGWRVFWIGEDWKQARFADKEKLVILDPDSQEVPIATMVGKLRDEFYTQLVGTQTRQPVAPQQQTKPKEQANQQIAKPADADTSAVSGTLEPVSYATATVKPTFGGRDASTFSDWVRRHIRFPESARKQELSGKTKIKFVIDTLGNVTHVRVVESAGKRTKEEFEAQVKLASYICTQYKGKLDDLVRKNGSIASIMDLQQKYEEAQQYYNRLRRLATNRNYVLPEYAVLDNEAKRVVASSPQWGPGEYRYQLVPVEYTITVDMKP